VASLAGHLDLVVIQKKYRELGFGGWFAHRRYDVTTKSR
jgi:hypothetical protein